MWPVAVLAEFGGELDALGFAAGELRAGLAELDVAEADVVEGFEHPVDAREVFEEGERFFDRHAQHVGDVLAAVVDLQRLGVVARAVADFAVDVDVGQEVHLDALGALALAGFAAAAFDVEAEAAGLVAADFRFAGLGEDLADLVEHAGVGRGIAARRSADGAIGRSRSPCRSC